MGAESLPKVVQFSTSHSGGAGIAARNLNSALNTAGFKSSFFALVNENFIPVENEYAVNRSQNHKIIGAASTFFHNQIFNETYFTLGSLSALNLADIIEIVPRGAIIHVHNWFNLLNLKLLEEILNQGYRVIFTLHDMRILTGGCHYSLKCRGYLSDCSDCPYLARSLHGIPIRNLERIREIMGAQSNRVHFIVPSDWLKQVAVSANLIPESQIHFIPNIHPSAKTIYGKPQKQIRRSSEGILNIGIASVNTDSRLKGGDLLAELMQNCDPGKVRFEFLGEYLASGKSQQEFWDEIDYLLVSSRADNSPNVIHEAKLMDIAIIGTRVGGITELLNYNFDVGIELSDLSSPNLLKAIEILHSDIGSYRPRFYDHKYHQYVQHALESTIKIYEEISAW